MQPSLKKIIITTGDSDGIGTEVTAKSLLQVGPQKNIQFSIIRSRKMPPSQLKLIDKKFKRISFNNVDRAAQYHSANKNELCDIVMDAAPAEWVYEAATACKNQLYSALVTGPMSKSLRNGRVAGHTEILKEVSGASDVFMCFLGSQFNVLSLTGHIPLQSVSQNLSATRINRAIELLGALLPHLKKSSKKPIAVLGVNPHAGEGGLLGQDEVSLLTPAIAKLRSDGFNVVGPLVPDAAFSNDNFKKYSFFVCPYHDQALIPFKLVHGYDSGVHLSLGLPFPRTSVDHGTAKDIFGKNRAHSGSMKDAITWALRLTK